MRADDENEGIESYDEEQPAFGFYGPTRPEDDQMMSLMQADTYYGEVLDDQIDKIEEFQQSADDDGFVCQINSRNDGSIENMAGEEVHADDD